MFGKIAPHKRLTINVHLDGMRETHDKVCAREGVFDKAIEMIREAKRRGYHVTTNTTVFKETVGRGDRGAVRAGDRAWASTGCWCRPATTTSR